MDNGTPENNNPATEPTNSADPKSVDYEKRFKDTQAAFTKSQQALREKEAEIEALKKLAPAAVTLSPEKQEELEKLKYSDPDAWRVALNAAEREASEQFNSKLSEATTEARTKAGMEFEITRRAQVLDEFNQSSEIKITPDVIEEDIPPRLKKKLENNEVSFEDFLTEARDYLSKGKTVANPDVMNEPDMGNVVGGTNPLEEKPGETLTKRYSKIMY